MKVLVLGISNRVAGSPSIDVIPQPYMYAKKMAKIQDFMQINCPKIWLIGHSLFFKNCLKRIGI